MIRHYIEIRLKEIIDEGNKLNNQVVKVPKHHDLADLWKKAQDILMRVWKDQYEVAPKDVSDFVNEFHSIDVKSDNFRYPIDKNGNENLKNICEINFKKLTEAFQNVKNYLDGVTDGIAILLD